MTTTEIILLIQACANALGALVQTIIVMRCRR